MGSISVQTVIDDASILLEDRVKKTWPAAELLKWANAGQLAICQFRPDAYTAVRTLQLSAGTRQSLPAADLTLIDLPRNLGLDGDTPGRACRYIERKQLDLANPGWHTVTASSTVRHWMYDREVPRVFWVYPQQPTTSRGYVELLTGARPTDMTIVGIDGAAVTSAMTLDDIWYNPLLQFCIYRAFSKDNEYTQPGGKASLAWQEFMQTLGLKTETDKQFHPRKSQPPPYSAPPKSDQQGAFG